jgi:hypothetical protein
MNTMHAPRKLYRNASNKSALPTSVAAASGEEEAGTKMLLCSI